MCRSVVPICLALLATSLAGQTPAAAPRIDLRRLRLTAETLGVYVIRGGDTTQVGSAVSVLRSDGKVLTRTYAADAGAFSLDDTIQDRFDDMRPVSHRSHSRGGVSQLAFGSARVTGWARLANGDSVTVDEPLPPVFYNGASFDLIVRASPLREGLELRLPAFEQGPNVVTRMQGRVTGSDTVDGRPCWVFRGDNGGIPVTFWIDKETASLRRQAIQFAVDVTHLLAAPRPLVRITDAEKERLVVSPTAVQHPDFGFSVPLPGPGFVSDTALQGRLNRVMVDHPNMFAWVLRNPARSFLVILEIYKGFPGTEPALREFATGMSKDTFSGHPGWEVLEDSVYWEGKRRESRLVVRGATGLHIKSRCIPSWPPQGPAVLVCAQAMSKNADSLDLIVDGLQVGPQR